MNPCPKKTAGFTLIEMAMVVILAGLFVSGFLDIFKIWEERQLRQIAADHIQVILDAMAHYYQTSSRYPCPVPRIDPGAPYDHSKRCLMTDPDDLKIAAARGIFYSQNESNLTVVEGGVPYRDLNIRKEETLDGWGNDISYVMTANFTALEKAGSAKGAIGIKDDKGESLITPPDSAIWALVIHGTDGAGAYSVNGSVHDCEKDHLDGANCDRNAEFVAAQLSLGKGAAYYDDQVWYRTWTDLPQEDHDYCAVGAQDISPHVPKLVPDGGTLKRCNSGADRAAGSGFDDDNCLFLICRNGKFIEQVKPVALPLQPSP